MSIFIEHKNREYRGLGPSILPNIHINLAYMNTTSNVANIPIWQNRSLKDLPNETWSLVKKFGGAYSISTLGRVKSMERIVIGKNGCSTHVKTKILSQHLTTGGYLRAPMTNKKRVLINPLVHRVVAKAFIPNPDNKPQTNHKNGIKSDNRVHNLEWVTRSENIIHAYKNNLIRGHKGESSHRSKLTKKEVIEIKTRISCGETAWRIANDYSVCFQQIYRIKNGERWSHIKI